MYNNVETTAAASGNVDCDDEVMDVEDAKNQGEIYLEDWKFRCDLAHERWTALYDHKGTAKLKATMMRNLYKQKLGEQAMATAFDMCESYDPLSCRSINCCQKSINVFF